MNIEIIKYISPVALLALIWTIFQFYQKRFHYKSDLTNEKTIDTYRKVEVKLSEIKNEYWKLFAIVSQTTLEMGNMIEKSKKEKEVVSKIKERITNLSFNKELEKLHLILEKIKKSDYDEEKKIAIIKKQFKVAKKEKKELEIHLVKVKKELEYNEKIAFELTKFINKRNETIYKKVKESSAVLQKLILEINSIPLVGTKINYELKSLLFQLKTSTQNFINLSNSIENITTENIEKIVKSIHIESSMKIIDNIEHKIIKFKN